MRSIRQTDSRVPADRADAGAAPDGESIELEIPVLSGPHNVFASTLFDAELTKNLDTRL
jgi:hypothetical protein